MKLIKLTLLFTCIFMVFTSCNKNKSTEKWKIFFQENNVEGTFVLKDLSSNKVLVYNQKRSAERFVPASTFKILNSMIALQVSAIQSVNEPIKWDGVDKGYKPWNKDHTMKSAFKVSCVWFYQELAGRIGLEKMQKWISKSNYGNKKIENKIDRFWLDGKLAISANEQIDFIEKLVNNKLPFDVNIQKTVKRIMITDTTKNYIIHSKTGWSNNIGWNVGYIEANNNIWVFALNIDMKEIKQGNIRKKIVYSILEEQKIIE